MLGIVILISPFLIGMFLIGFFETKADVENKENVNYDPFSGTGH